MSRYSDYARNRNPGIASSDIDDPFEGFPSDDPYDRHLGDPRYRRYSPEGYGDGRLRIIASDPFMSEPTNPHLSERCTRGYNPPYYGRAPSYTGSQPGGGDYGFGLENPDVAFGTPMGNGYAEYKKLDARSDLYKAGYEGRRNGIPPRPPPKLQTEEYVGSPPMIRRHHRELYDHASGAADAARDHHQARADFDEDYRFHYKDVAQRNGHLKAIDNGRKRETKLRNQAMGHKKHGVDYYYDS